MRLRSRGRYESSPSNGLEGELAPARAGTLRPDLPAFVPEGQGRLRGRRRCWVYSGRSPTASMSVRTSETKARAFV